ncbi:MAG: acyl-CoA dehydrogenase [Hyphomicrobiales bacterium]|nr:acyl-CoA dehydrogenase [Hyphomicrobiales bacterium]
MVYRAPVADMLFTMSHAAGLTPAVYPDLADSADAILDEAAKMAEGALAPLFRIGDTDGARFENGVVRTSPGWREAYAQWIAGGWMGVTAAEDHGGMGLPHLLNAACLEMWNGANMAFALAPLLSLGAIEALAAHGSDDLRARYLPRVVSGEWSATMNLTEPQAGSDLAALRTRAERTGDGAYAITGEKIYITYGEHDMTDNIVHLVLARLPDAPAGTRGISLFLVPKFLVGADGAIGAHNALRCAGIEHKMGIHGSPTCTMLFEGAAGWLIGEENRGLACMFTMMNNARLAVGLQGVGMAERATQTALAFAQERRQGRAPGDPAPMSAIVRHPDVQRMLVSMQATTAAARAICYMTANAIDLSHRAETPDARRAAQERAGLLTPVAKAYGSDIANETASLCVQVYGGMGFIEEAGAAQLMRDARIAAIYEGTNGIQAIDLVTRKLGLSGGAAFTAELARLRAALTGVDPALAPRLTEAIDALERAGAWLSQRLANEPAAALAGAAPFLRLFALALGGVALAQCAQAEGDPQGRWHVLARFFVFDMASHAPALARSIEDSADALLGAAAFLEA